MWNRWIMHLWVFAQCHTDPLRHHKADKKSTERENDLLKNWPCQMLAGSMNFHLITLELVQLLPYRCLRSKRTSSVSPGVSLHTCAQVVKLTRGCYENGETSDLRLCKLTGFVSKKMWWWCQVGLGGHVYLLIQCHQDTWMPIRCVLLFLK